MKSGTIYEVVSGKACKKFSLLDGSFVYLEADKCNGMGYFCDEEGVKFGNEYFSQMILPNNILKEALRNLEKENN